MSPQRLRRIAYRRRSPICRQWDEREGPIAVKDRRLGTDRRRSRQRTVFVSDVSYATVYLVRNALAGIERATCSTERLAVRTASCGSRRERFAARRVGEHVSSDVSLKTAVRQEELDGEREPSEVLTEVSEVAELVEYSQPFCASVWASAARQEQSFRKISTERVYRFDGSTVLIIKTDMTYTACSLDVGERIAHALNGGEAKNTDGGRPPAYAAAIGP
ncbi:hypothetical protein EMIHUDRAFT_217609 [Emiliania huxleyi CCMP1516]|uniref:Uncharacterized protein n=2 Tax=Emiliania huxleyi TaxID=2903 RepID=A0A0D3IAZ1_EMIH1|nr:hypothetical protein EMIHUDRAFT_217609 [Emiliania huxleyi CCMP1516]EOD08426.1 hypothetical protein EMIHUDRAFT_217609 [Emiliania huxleyi CCMP1516]|eukprot:XP_005760855.1 hypothetical protein EMIHUDRAFT_217609 [Emiliania huxleyi CCMP1516]